LGHPGKVKKDGNSQMIEREWTPADLALADDRPINTDPNGEIVISFEFKRLLALLATRWEMPPPMGITH
jgi:hypothetical protein